MNSDAKNGYGIGNALSTVTEMSVIIAALILVVYQAKETNIVKPVLETTVLNTQRRNCCSRVSSPTVLSYKLESRHAWRRLVRIAMVLQYVHVVVQR